MRRAHVDDGAAAALVRHLSETGPSGEEGAVEVDGQHPLPVGKLQIGERRDVLHAGIADQHVHAAQPFGRLRHALIHLALVSDVHRHAERIAAQRARRLLRAADVGDADLRAFLQVPLGDGSADPAGGAGDDGDLVLHPHKGLFRRRESSPNIPRRNATTEMTKITPSATSTQDPVWER